MVVTPHMLLQRKERDREGWWREERFWGEQVALHRANGVPHEVHEALPWHVRATILSSTQVVCRTPPTAVAPSSLLPAAVDLSLSGQLADLGSSGLGLQA